MNPTPLFIKAKRSRLILLYHHRYYAGTKTLNRKQKNKLGLKLVVYYIALMAFVAVLIRLFPQLLPLLLFGGLDALQQGNDLVT